MSTQLETPVLPTTPPRITKRHLTAPVLQRAGHASLSFQYPPRFSVLSSGLLPSPTSPFDGPTLSSEETWTQDRLDLHITALPPRKINHSSFPTVPKQRQLTRHESTGPPQQETTVTLPTLGKTWPLHQSVRQNAVTTETHTRIHTSRKSYSSGPATDRSAASSRLSRHSALSDTSKTLLALFPLPPKLGHSLLDSSSPETSAGPETPLTYFQNEASLEIELDELPAPTEPYSPLGLLQARARTYSLPKPPPRQNKALPMLPPRSVSEEPRITPPRAIFSDYSTAFQAIRSKSTKDLHDISHTRDLPLPPIPARSPARHRSTRMSAEDDGTRARYDDLSATFPRKLAQVLDPQGRRRDAIGMLFWQNESKSLKHSTRALLGRRRNDRPVFDALARFSMPEVSVLQERDAYFQEQDHHALLHSSSSQPDSFSPSSSIEHDSEHGHPSTNRGSQDSAERFVDSYVKRDMIVRKPSFRRYSALPRLQNIRSDGSIDGTTSTIGDILSQYGDPEYRSLPTSMSQRLLPLQNEHRPGKFPSHASLFSIACDLHEEDVTLPDIVAAEVLENPLDEAQEPASAWIKPPPPALVAPSVTLRTTIRTELRLDKVDSLTPLVDYGETRDLLQISSSSIDVDAGRGNAQTRMSLTHPAFTDPATFDLESSSQSDATIDELVTAVSSPPDHRALQIEGSGKHLVTLEVAHFSQQTSLIAGPRDLEKFEVDDSNDTAATTTTSTESYAQHAAPDKVTVPLRQHLTAGPESGFVLPVHPASDQLALYLAEQQSASQIKSSVTSVRQSALAAFAPSDVLPAAYRSSPSKELKNKKLASERQRIDDHLDVALEVEHSDDEGDWETVGGSHRTASRYNASLKSAVDVPSNKTKQSIQSLGIHPADQQYKHIYHLRSPPGSAESILVPSYVSGSEGFPYHNSSHAAALHPVYQPRHENDNPFRDISNFSHTSIDSVSFEDEEEEQDDRAVPYGFWRGRPNLSVVYEQSGERSSDTELGDNHVLMAPSVIATAPSRIGSSSTAESSSAWVSCGPGPEISSADGDSAWQHGQDVRPLRSRPSSIMASGANTSFVKSIRRNPSSLVSETSNTFNKMSKLGPHGNITGSINGTNMRLVGSSIAGSSSPLASPKSTHSVQQTPRRLEAPQPALQRTSSLIEESSSMNSSWHRPRSYMIPRTLWREQVPKIRPSSKHTAQLLSPIRGDGASRTVMTSQKAFLERSLEGARSITTSIGRPKHTYQHDGSSASPLQGTPQHGSKRRSRSVALDRMPNTLLPIANPAHHANIASPHLIRAYRPPSSQMEDINPKKQKISWICFALFALFPPMLIFFGHGLADPIMWFLSGRKIEHFGTRQKEFGKLVGYFVTGSIVVGLVVALVVIRTVPNSLPK